MRVSPPRGRRWPAVTLVTSGVAALAAVTLLVAEEQKRPPPAGQFEQAVTLMDAKGDYASAARLFETIAESSDRALAARALVYLAHCFERTGTGQAQEVYRRVIDSFQDQPAAVADARARLTELERRRAPAGSMARSLRPLWERVPAPSGGIGRPSYDGRFLPLIDRDAKVMLHNLTTQRVGPPIPIGKADAMLPECSPGPAVTLSPDGSHVAFSCEPEGGGSLELRVARLDPVRFSVRRILSAAPGESVEVLEWSSPNTLLAQAQAADGTARLATVSLTGASRALVPLAAPTGSASLSPDGSWVVFDGPSDEPSKSIDVFIAPLSGGAARRLVEGPFNDRSPLWAPDGRGIVFVSDRTGTPGLWYQAVEQGAAEAGSRLLFPDLGRIATVLALTRSGKYLYFRETGLVDVYVVDLGPDGLPVGAPANPSTRRIGQNLMPTWSPDGARLAYVSREQGIVVRDVHAGLERVLGSRIATVTQPRWSPNGETLVARGWDLLGRYGLFTVDVASGQSSTLKVVPPAGESALSTARWSRDGRAIVYGLGNDIVRMDVETREERVVHTFQKELSVSIGDVSAVDDSILLVQGERGSRVSSLVVLTPDGTLQRLLDSDPSERFSQPIWLPDARGVLFSRVRTNAEFPSEARRPTLWRMDLDTRAVRPLGITLDGARDPAVTGDGRRLAFTAGYPTREPWLLEHFLPAAPARAPVRR